MERALLENLGLTHEAALLYEALLDRPDTRFEQLGDQLPETTDSLLRQALSELVDAGFATRGKAGHHVAVPPAVAIPSRLLLRTEQANAVSSALPTLTERFWAARTPADKPDFIEVVRDRNQGLARWAQMDRLTQRHVRAFDTPPYITSPVSLNDRELDSIGRGVTYRIVYSQAAVDIPGRWPILQAEFNAGEIARVRPTLPAKLTLFDEFAAIVSFVSGEPANPASTVLLLIYESPLLDLLQELFELIWAESSPLSEPSTTHGVAADDGSMLTDAEENVLRLLIAGMSDETIQRHLRISASTVQRRMRRLFDAVGARSRFHAGYAFGRLATSDQRRPEDK